MYVAQQGASSLPHGWIIIWRLPSGVAPAERTKFHTAFYGQHSSSHQGRYAYRREGLLDTIAHRKLGRGIVLVRDAGRSPVEDLLRQHAEEIHVRRVRLEPEDIEAMSATTPN